MAKHIVARVSDIADGGRLIVTLQGRSIGVFNVKGRFYALLNRCPHQGGPLCRGSVLGKLDADGPGQLTWSDDGYMLQCPWHGWEYDLATGQSYFDSRVRSYPVGVEQGEQVRHELEVGDAQPTPDSADAIIASGNSGPLLKPGPFVAETYPITIEDDYIAVTLPGRTRRPDPAAPGGGP
jgi:3-phenylpropionate/trans-cinnamate dioxygenase ferredoxin subunit